MKLLLYLLLAVQVFATTKTVCASGCDETNFQTALTATASDCAIDVIELRAGETFSGAFVPPYRACTGTVWVRSSRYAELPSVGNRVGPEHLSLMPILNATTVNTPALAFYEVAENNMSGVDTGTEIMTIASTSTLATGTAFSCSNTPPPPMVGGTVYYSILVDGTHFQASLTPGGSAINLTGAGSTGDGYYQQPHCTPLKPRANWRFTGMKVTVPSGTAMAIALVRIGGLESNILSVPRNIWFDRNLIQGHGDMSADYPNGGIEFHGVNITITDNYFSDIRCFSCEGKPLMGWGFPGPARIENNYVGGGSIGLLLGGADSAIPNYVSENVQVLRNYFSKPGKEMYREGAGAPSGACYYGGGSGMFYRNTSSSGTTCSLSGRCYSCQTDNTWAIDLTADYRSDDFLTKNPIELKGSKNVLIEGNIFEGQQATVDSQGNCLLLVASTNRYLQDITIRNNRCTDTWGGLSITSYSSPTILSRDVLVENNLITGMGSPRLLNMTGATSDSVFQMRAPLWQSLVYRHNTHRPDASASISTGYGIFLESSTVGMPAFTKPGYLADNIWWYATAGSRTDSGGTLCTVGNDWGSFFLNDGTKNVLNNVQFGGTGVGGLDACATTQNLSAVASIATVDFASDSSLNTTSPYSAACAAGCSFAATDGGDVGVDLLRLNTAISGVTAGNAGMRVQMDIGSVGAIARYTSATSAACTVKLYTNLSRQTLHGDTDTGGEQIDSRTGSVTVGTDRQLVLGTNTALTASTPYWLTVTCGSTVALASFRTNAAGSGTYNVSVKYATAIAGEYSSSADMSTPTTISSATTHTVPIPTGSVRYYKQTGGAVKAMISM